MSATNIILILICVIAISGGQLLFKRAGLELELAGTWLSWRVWLYSGVSFAVYTGATLLWIHVLRVTPLIQAYPFMALSFVIVPLSGAWFFKEQLGAAYLIGLLLIISGVVLIARSGQWQ